MNIQAFRLGAIALAKNSRRVQRRISARWMSAGTEPESQREDRQDSQRGSLRRAIALAQMHQQQ